MRLDTHPLTDALITSIVEINPLQAAFMDASLATAEAGDIDDLESYIRFCNAQGVSLTYLASCYDVIVKDTLCEQLYFQRHKCYRYATFDEVAHSVYFNDAYMRQYMYGLALTSYLWPNHRELHHFFVQHLPREQRGAYLEIGPGHGIYMVSAMRLSAYTVFEGLDLSPTSVALTDNLLGSGHFGEFNNYTVCQKDFLADDHLRDSYDAIVMGEVLEHVESPSSFLKKIHALSHGETFIFITTPINAPAIDHIYLFDSLQSVEQIVSQSGLRIAHCLRVPYPGCSLEQSEQQSLPINVAMVLAK